MSQGYLDQRENQASQGIRVCRALLGSQGLQGQVAPLDHQGSQAPKESQASQGPQGSLELGSRESQDFMDHQGNLEPWVPKGSLACQVHQALQDHRGCQL